MIKTKALYINLFLTIVALGLHIYLAHKHFLLQVGQASGESMCNLGGLWNCDAVNSSPYSKLFGFPLAAWGLAANLVFIFCQIRVLLNKDPRDFWADLTVYFASAIAIASVVMGLIAYTQIGSFCLFCFMAYIISFISLGILAAAGLSFKASWAGLLNNLKDKTTWILVILIPILTVFFSQALGQGQNNSRMTGMVQDQVAAWKGAPEQTFEMSEGLHMGAPVDKAALTIIEFADFRCPHCKHAAPSIKAFVGSRQDVALIFKPYPLDGTCNLSPGFGGQGDGISCRLAFAVMCAQREQQNGWKMFDDIFNHQMEYSGFGQIEDVDKRLCDSGLVSNCEKFKACMDEESIRVSVQKMAQEGTTAGIRGTPAFFVNKKMLNGAQFLPVLEKTYSEVKNQSH